MERRTAEIIEMLSTNGLYAECPSCGETIQVRNAHLFYSDNFNATARKTYDNYVLGLQERKEELKTLKESIKASSEAGAKAVNIGLILERMLPSLDEFPFCCEDCRSLLDPIDYLVFEGLAAKGTVDKLFWVEIKTGQARLSSREREIKQLVEGKKLVWDIYRQEVGDEQ